MPCSSTRARRSRSISGEHEAALSFLGATAASTSRRRAPYLVLDIGGGSTEFVVGATSRPRAISTQMGSVRLTERFVTADPPATEELDADGRRRSRSSWTPCSDAMPSRDARTFVAVAGTATTVQAISLGLPFYDPERITGRG